MQNRKKRLLQKKKFKTSRGILRTEQELKFGLKVTHDTFSPAHPDVYNCLNSNLIYIDSLAACAEAVAYKHGRFPFTLILLLIMKFVALNAE